MLLNFGKMQTEENNMEGYENTRIIAAAFPAKLDSMSQDIKLYMNALYSSDNYEAIKLMLTPKELAELISIRGKLKKLSKDIKTRLES